MPACGWYVPGSIIFKVFLDIIVNLDYAWGDLVFAYSFSFQTNSLNILLSIRNSKMTVFSGKMMLISIDWQSILHALKISASYPKN